MRAGLIQLSSGDDPARNLEQTLGYLAQAADRGAEFIATPEVTNCVSLSRRRQIDVLSTEDSDRTLAACRDFARTRAVWLLIGSLALKRDDDTRFANRSFLIAPSGTIAARYDKIHMFDVTLSETERYRESDGYRPGESAVVAETPWGGLGLTVCYDLRFPKLFRDLAQSGARIISVPAAFAPETGRAHWEVLLRARAIETGSFVLAPAQCGTHAANTGKSRITYGHSLAVDPWGRVLADGGETPGVTMVDLDLSTVDQIRGRVPSLTHDRDYTAP